MSQPAELRPRFLWSQLKASTAARVLGGGLTVALCGSLLWTGQRVSVTLTPHTRWHLMPHPSSHYSDYQTFAGQKRYLQDAVNVVSSAGSIDFSDVSILYLVAPPTAQVFTSSPAFIANPRDGVIAGGKMVRHGVTVGRDFVSEAQGGWGFKVVNDEAGHLFGLPDLYNYQPVPNIHAAAGGWDMMGLISGPAPDYLAWHRWKMAWLADAQVACVTARGQVTQVLRPLHEAGGGVRAVVVRTGPQRAVVVENRQANSLDKGRCFRAGVLVYTVDASVEGGQLPVRVVDGHPATGTSGCKHGRLT